MVYNTLIAHVLLEIDGNFLFLKRSMVKRGKKNFLPGFWDILGGTVEEGETPRQAAIREVYEETGVKVFVNEIIHEDSNYDARKQTVFTRLVYRGSVLGSTEITLDPEEQTEYILSDSINEVPKPVDYLKEIFQKQSLLTKNNKQRNE